MTKPIKKTFGNNDGDGARNDHHGDKYILVLDVGTTNVRAHIYDQRSQIVGQSCKAIETLSPRQGYHEISAQTVWEAVLETIKKAVEAAKINISQILCLGISAQRGTFITWNRKTGEPFHNFITWKDIRSEQLCKQWNQSFQMKCLRLGAKFVRFITGSNRFIAASLLKFSTGMVVMRLVWVLQNIPEVRLNAIQEGNALYGTLDTYLVWKLTGGRVHASDPSNTCITGFYDPFLMSYAQWALNMFDIPPSMLPTVNDTNGDFGRISSEWFGVSIPIRTVVGDQSAAMFGECCHREGDVKCTLGTGTFININTGQYPLASYKGLYPIVGWKLTSESKPTYLIEGASYDTGTAIVWSQLIGLIDDLQQSSDLVQDVHNNGLYFVPSFSGIQAPVNDNTATTAFIGLSPSTTKAQLVRSVFESICFRVKQIYEIILEEQPNLLLKQFRIDGGVSNNDFIVQLIADLTGKKVERADHREMSSLGTAYLAGLAVGYWTDLKDVSSLRHVDKVFLPRNNWKNCYRFKFEGWERAIERCLHWNKN